MIFGIVFCLIFTAADVFPEDDSSRTDSGRASGIDQAPWFSFPYPGQWGNPTFLASAVIAMISGPVSQPNEIIGGIWSHCRISDHYDAVLPGNTYIRSDSN